MKNKLPNVGFNFNENCYQSHRRMVRMLDIMLLELEEGPITISNKEYLSFRKNCDKKQVGDMLVSIRKELKLSKIKFARLLGLTTEQPLNAYEAGINHPSKKVLESIKINTGYDIIKEVQRHGNNG